MAIVTHEMDFARDVSNRVFYMDEGTIYEEGAPQQIFENPQKEKTRAFIHRIRTFNHRILSVDYDLYAFNGEIERYVVRVRDGVATVAPGDAGEQRDATVTCQGYDYLRLATGHLSPVMGVLKGQLRVRGDKGKALQLSSILDIPSAR